MVGIEGKEAAERSAMEIVNAATKPGAYKRAVARGTAQGIAFEIPQEVTQQVLERWQAGLPLNPFNDPNAAKEYLEAAGGALLLGGPMGAYSQAANTFKARQTPEGQTILKGVTEGSPLYKLLKEEENAGQPINPPSGTSTGLAGQPSTNVAPPGGAEGTETAGVVSTGKDATTPDVGENGQPPDITPLKTTTPYALEKPEGGNSYAKYSFTDENGVRYNVGNDGEVHVTVPPALKNQTDGIDKIVFRDGDTRRGAYSSSNLPAFVPNSIRQAIAQHVKTRGNNGQGVNDIAAAVATAKTNLQNQETNTKQITKQNELFSKKNMFMDDEETIDGAETLETKQTTPQGQTTPAINPKPIENFADSYKYLLNVLDEIDQKLEIHGDLTDGQTYMMQKTLKDLRQLVDEQGLDPSTADQLKNVSTGAETIKRLQPRAMQGKLFKGPQTSNVGTEAPESFASVFGKTEAQDAQERAKELSAEIETKNAPKTTRIKEKFPSQIDLVDRLSNEQSKERKRFGGDEA